MNCLKPSDKNCKGCPEYNAHVRECTFKNMLSDLLEDRLSERAKADKVTYLSTALSQNRL